MPEYQDLVSGNVLLPRVESDEETRHIQARALCDRIALAIAPTAHLAPGRTHEPELRAQLAATATPILQALGLIDYEAVHRNPNQGVNPVVHGTRSAVEWHATQTESRFCGPCQRWIDVHNRTGRGTPIGPKCGSKKGCRAHHRDGEDLCVACQAWSDQQHERARIEPGSRCGTQAGARHHVDLGERICERCRTFEASRSADRRLHVVEGG